MSNKKTVTQTGTTGGSQSGTSSSSGSFSNTGTSTTSRSGTASGTSRNLFDWMQMPDSPDIAAFRDYKETIDPSVDYSYARRQKDIKSSFNNPLGAFTSAGVRDASLRSNLGDLEQSYGQQRRVAYNDMQGRTAARKADLAALTAPRLTQTGTDTSSTQQETGTDTTTNSGSSQSTGTNQGTYTGTSSGTQVSNGGKMADFLQSAFQGVAAAAVGHK